MRAIFISYRRDDAEGHAGRLFEDLSDRFGKTCVFMDVAGIEPGRDFRRVIEQQVASCGVLLAIIGKNWLTAADDQGRRRLDDPYDFVRLETASALQRDIPVVPVLVHGARMPRPEQLPDALKNLAFRNSVELTHARWSSDVQFLINALMPYVDAGVDATPKPAPRSTPTPTGPSLAASEQPAILAAGGSAVALPSPPVTPEQHAPRRSWLTPLLAALAIGVAGAGYVIVDRAAKRQAPEPAAKTIAADKRGRETSLPEKAASGSTIAAPVPIETGTAGDQAMPPRPVVVPSEAPRKTARLAAEKAEAERIARAKAVAKPAATASPAVAAEPERAGAERTAAQRTPAERPAPERLTTERPTAERPVAERPVADRPVADRPATDKPEPAATASARDPLLDLLGSPARPSSATRTIAIDQRTRYVNVTGGEIIQFTMANKAFAWNFNGRANSFDLTRVAPPGLLDHKVTAYVAPNPLYGRPRR